MKNILPVGLKTLFCVVISLFTITACGQKGALYLPQEAPAKTEQQADKTDESSNKEKQQ